MGIGGTAKKLQKVVEMGEELYTRINDLRTQVAEMRETVGATHDRVDRLENEVAEQRVILEALAEAEGVDVEALVAEAHITEAESDGSTADESGTGDATGDDADSASTADDVDATDGSGT
jgi:peptidoglycan hydrolase CwlO-like protein